MANPFWTESIPIWVSRKTNSGQVVTFSVPGWIWMLIMLLVTLNVIVWGFIGLYTAVTVIL